MKIVSSMIIATIFALVADTLIIGGYVLPYWQQASDAFHTIATTLGGH